MTNFIQKSSLIFSGNSLAVGASGMIGTPGVNWPSSDPAFLDITGGIWMLVSGVLTPIVGDYRTDWALRPIYENAFVQEVVAYTTPVMSTDVYVVLSAANQSTGLAYSYWFMPSSGLYIRTISPSVTTTLIQTGFVATVGHSYILIGIRQHGTLQGSYLSFSVADQSAPGVVLATVSFDNDNTNGLQIAGSIGVAEYLMATSRFTRIDTFSSSMNYNPMIFGNVGGIA